MTTPCTEHGPILATEHVRWCRTCGALRHADGRWEEPTHAIPATYDEKPSPRAAARPDLTDLRVAAEAIDRLHETKDHIHRTVRDVGMTSYKTIASAIGDIFLALDGLYKEAAAARARLR